MDFWVTQLCTEVRCTALFNDAVSTEVYVKSMIVEHTNIKHWSNYDDGGNWACLNRNMSQGLVVGM